MRRYLLRAAVGMGMSAGLLAPVLVCTRQPEGPTRRGVDAVRLEEGARLAWPDGRVERVPFERLTTCFDCPPAEGGTVCVQGTAYTRMADRQLTGVEMACTEGWGITCASYTDRDGGFTLCQRQRVVWAPDAGWP